MEEFITACPRNCYSTCTFRVQVENNKIRRILPYSGNLATPEGPCIKGLSYIERNNSDQRIIHPLLKTADGNFKEVSTEEAFNIISRRLASIRSEYGSKSIFWYRGSGMSGLTNDIGHSFWKAFGGTTTTYGNLCWPAGLEAVRLTLGSVKHNVPWDLENAGTIIIWGKNPAETNIQEIAFMAKAREKGGKIVVIDPVRTPTADKADILFSPKPGTDAALALAIARVLVYENLIDLPFIGKYVVGFEHFKNSLQITTADAERITGIPAGNIEELAHLIARSGPVTFLPGYGLQRHLNGGQTIRAILSLAILSGNIGRPGAGFNYANLQSYIFDNTTEPLSYYPDPEKDLPFRRTVSSAKLGRDMLTIRNPELKAAWVERGNPLLQSPDSNNVRRAFLNLEFKVVVEQFMTDTAEIADIILPAKDMFEQSDIISSYWSPYIQLKPGILDSPGEVMPESEIYYYLAEKLDLKISTDIIPKPGNKNIEEWLEARIKGYSALKLEDLKHGPVLAPGLQLIAYKDMKFDTPSGKIELYSSEAAEKWGCSPSPDYTPINQPDEKEKFPLNFITSNTGSRLHSQFGNLKIIKDNVGIPVVGLSSDDAAKRNIRQGDRIRVFSATGEIYSTAGITNRIPAGIVVLPNGIRSNEGGGGNHLIEGRETDMGYGSAFHDNSVEVERVN